MTATVTRFDARAARIPALTAGRSRRGMVSVVLDAAGSVLAVLGLVWFARKGLFRPPNSYDEGILLSNAHALLRGKALYRDVYANYPPGAFWLVALAIKAVGSSYTVLRLLGLAVHVGIAGLSGRLAGRIVGRRFSLLAAGFSLVWSIRLLAIPFAWMLALLVLLAAVDRGLAWQGRWTPMRLRVVGALGGLVGCFRHDLFLYCVLVGFVAAAASMAMLLHRNPEWRPNFRQWAAFASGTVIVLLLVWAPTIAAAGWSNVIHDLYLDQVKYVLPGRNLPLIPLLPVVRDSWNLVAVPTFLADSFPAAVILTLAAPAVGALALLGRHRHGRIAGQAALLRREGIRLAPTTPVAAPAVPGANGWQSWDEIEAAIPSTPRPAAPVASGPDAGTRRMVALAVTTALSMTMIPQLLQRTDGTHALFAVTPALLLAAAFIERLARGHVYSGRLLGIMLLALSIIPIELDLSAAVNAKTFHSGALGGRFGNTEESTNARAVARVAAVEFLRTNAPVGTAVYSGCTSHRHAWANELDLYFLSDRVGGTKYLQFDPGMQNTERVQRRMAADLEANSVRAVVLADCARVLEANTSANAGSGFLDTWLAEHYTVVRSIAGYQFLIRK